MRRGYRRVRGDFAPWLADLDLSPRPLGVEREALLAALRSYFAGRSIEANWDAIRRMPDEALVVTLAMVCPFEPVEKQALLEAPDDAERGATLLALLQMGAAGTGAAAGPGGKLKEITGMGESIEEPRRQPPIDPRLLEILVCPLTKGPLEYDREANELISRKAGLAYPVRDGIPIMLPEEARKLDA